MARGSGPGRPALAPARERDRADDGRADHPGAERNRRRTARPRRDGAARHRALPPDGDRRAGRAWPSEQRSPPLEAYLQALELFAQTFKPAGGLRLLRIARPPILLYGLYKTSQIEHDNALFDLVAVRGTLAIIFDGLFPSNAARGVQPQVLLDMVLLRRSIAASTFWRWALARGREAQPNGELTRYGR